MSLEKLETVAKGVNCQGQNSFPRAVHLGVFNGQGGRAKFHVIPLSLTLVGEGSQCDRQGKSFTKPFNLTLEVEFLNSDLCSLSQMKRLGISKKVVLFPELP